MNKELTKIPKLKNSLTEKYINDKINDDQYNMMLEKLDNDAVALQRQIENLKAEQDSYVSLTPNADSKWIQVAISHTAGENIVKDNLAEIGVFPKNRKDKSAAKTTDDKYNTHSLRKTFAEWFIETGENLNQDNDLHFDTVTLDLLKEKFKHSNKSITTHYTTAQEKAFENICKHMNIGLDILEKFIYG